MRASFLLAVAAAVAVAASPVVTDRRAERIQRRQSAGNSSGINDGVILNYALTLEHLEATFYATGLQNYSASDFQAAGYPDYVRERLTEIASEEATHVSYLTAGLQAAGATPVAACNYSFGVTGPQSFLATAQILEGVGVSAYIGAAQYITNKAYLTSAAEILAVEARHSAWIRADANKGDPFPNAFDVALGFNQVYTLASPFIASCPSSNPTLPVKAFPAVAASGGNNGAFYAGGPITLTPAQNVSASFVGFIGALNTTFVRYNGSSVTIPSGFAGQTYAILTNSNSTTGSLDDITVAGPAVFEIPIAATNFNYSSSTNV